MSTTFKPLRIGPLRIEFPVVLAALAGYTDLAYRTICRQLGAEYVSTEMMLARLLGTKWRRKAQTCVKGDHERPIAAQIIGNEPETMAAGAVELGRMGFDVVDLNFACPVNKALRRRRGGHLMRDPDLAVRIIRAVTEAASTPVTLKLRRSFDEADRDYEALWRIAEKAFDAGVASITVHGRSVEAKYVGPADWGIVAAVKRRFPDRTVIGSGDILMPADALRMLAQTGVDGVTVARGGLGNPWFFRQVRDLAAGREPHRPTVAEQREVIREHFDLAVALYGPRTASAIMRKFGIKYARSHPTPKAVRIAFVAVKRPEDWHAVLDEHYRDE